MPLFGDSPLAHPLGTLARFGLTAPQGLLEYASILGSKAEEK